jgi:hypothetical protein
MADPSPFPATGDETGVRPSEDRPPRAPRWVKVAGVIVVVLVLLLVGLKLTGVMDQGGHGPGPGPHVGGAKAPGEVRQP